MSAHAGLRAEERIDSNVAADALCAALMKTTSDLMALLDRETVVLRAGKIDELASLQLRKAALNAILMRDIAQFRGSVVFMREAVPSRLAALKEHFQLFQQTLDTNQAALSAMRAVSDALLKAIAAQAGAAQSGPETYGKNASTLTMPPRRPSAISVDRSL